MKIWRIPRSVIHVRAQSAKCKGWQGALAGIVVLYPPNVRETDYEFSIDTVVILGDVETSIQPHNFLLLVFRQQTRTSLLSLTPAKFTSCHA